MSELAVPVDEDAGRVSLKIFPQQIHGNSVSVGGFFYAQMPVPTCKNSCSRKAVSVCMN